jgi:hypothetical protein
MHAVTAASFVTVGAIRVSISLAFLTTRAQPSLGAPLALSSHHLHSLGESVGWLGLPQKRRVCLVVRRISKSPY